jgi:hypothetical protein
MLVHLVVVLLAHSSSSINAFVYGITNRNFSDGYKEVISKAFGKTVQTKDLATSTREGFCTHPKNDTTIES